MSFRSHSLLLIACLLPMAGCAAGPPPPVQVKVTEQVILESPARLGVNIGASNYWGDEQYVSNPFAHGSFPRGRQVMLLQVGQATGNTVIDGDFDPDDPDRHYVDSFQGGEYVIATGERAGEEGKIDQHSPTAGEFRFSRGGTPLQPGDLVWLKGPLTRRALPDPTNEKIEKTIGIGDFRPIAGDGVTLTFEDGGRDNTQVLALDFPAGSQRFRGGVKHYVRAQPDRSYTVVVRARTDTPGATLGVDMECYGLDSSDPGYRPEFVAEPESTLTEEWREYRFTTTTANDPRVGSRNGVINIVVSLNAKATAPSHAWIDSTRLEDPATQTETGFSAEVVEALQEARCGVLRFYGVASLGALVESITASDTATAPWSYWSLASRGRFNAADATVDNWMRLSTEVGAAPWITVGSSNTPADWYNLISYLSAPGGYDSYSTRRTAQGRENPWTNDFETIYLEIGNEWWNPIFRPFYAGSPEKYGELCSTILKRVREHPHYDPRRIKIVLGGWAINAHHWNGVVDEIAKNHDLVSIAPYLLHELDKTESLADRYSTLFADIDAYRSGGAASTLADLEKNKTGAGIAVYELNTHTTGGAASTEVVSGLAPSLGAGVAVLDQATTLMKTMKANPINYFTLLQRDYNGRIGLWGNLLRAESGDLRPRPVWQGLRLANRYLIEGDLVRTEVVGNSVWRQTENGSVPAIASVDGLHATSFLSHSNGKRRAHVLLINRLLSQDLEAHIALPFRIKSEARRILLTGSSPAMNNETSLEVALKEERVTLLAERPTLRVPPFSAVVVQFEEE